MRLVRALTLLAGFTLLATSAGARVTSPSPYTRAQTLNCALRYIRVDQGYEVTEKDVEAGSFLFKYRAGGGDTPGSIEVLEVQGAVKVVVQLPRMPEYHEQVLSRGLMSKLREDYGEPPPAESPKAPPPADDAPSHEDKDKPTEGGSSET